ncbi:hypothetical protein OXYTRIMIC_367 [Oxytricha trifallax]|uniref:Uncharacterized protein n=1 Tax=Oxytricha trifallax TaxID=1172189 RepID=A0A073HZH4_9SPIT|nr:hypothetical protein OXYTRIMIC_367 [Oxytricha trifallax]
MENIFQEGRMLSEEDLDNPIQKCFQEILEKHSKSEHWYNKPPEWVIRTNNQSTNKSFQDAKEKLNEAIRNMELCLVKNDVKGFYYLVKRLTKSRKQSEPIKGLTSIGERINLGEESLEKILTFYYKIYQDDRKQQDQKYNQAIK